MAGTMEGLSVPLYGGFTSYQASGTTASSAYLTVNDDGTHDFSWADEGADNFISVTLTDATTISSGYIQAYYASITSTGSKTQAQTGAQQNAFAADIFLGGTQAAWTNGMFVYIAETGTATITSSTIAGYAVYLAAFGASPASRHGFHVFSEETSTYTDATVHDTAFHAEGAGSGTYGALLGTDGAVPPHYFLDIMDTTDTTTRMIVDYSSSDSATKALRVLVGSTVYNIPMVADSCS